MENKTANKLTEEQFYRILFGTDGDRILTIHKAKRFYDKMHNQNDVILKHGELWYSGEHTFNDFDCSKKLRAIQQAEMMKIW